MRKSIAVLVLGATISAGPLAAQDRWAFESADSADFTTFSVVGDSTVDFGVDYGALYGIPEAPNFQAGDTATTGLAIGVNQDFVSPNEDAAGAWTNSVYSGNYRMEVDVYYFYPGGGGSTENMVIGINRTDTTRPGCYDQDNDASTKSGQDGYFLDFAGDIDIGGVDIFFMYGVPDTFTPDPPNPDILVPGQSPVDGTPNGFDRNAAQVVADGGGFAWADGLLPNENARNVEPAGIDPFFLERFPYSGLGYPGHITGVWTRFRFDYVDGVVTVSSNQYDTNDVDGDPLTTETGWKELLTYDDPLDRWTSGRVYLGMEDFFSGVNSVNFMIYDNLAVDILPPSVANGDANGDGNIDVADVTGIFNFAAGITGPPMGDGDVDNDTDVDATDANLLVDFLVNGTPLP